MNLSGLKSDMDHHNHMMSVHFRKVVLQQLEEKINTIKLQNEVSTLKSQIRQASLEMERKREEQVFQ